MIPLEYFQSSNVVFLAKDIIGKTLCSQIDGHLVKSIIVETEAYEGITDKASHAYNNRFTERTKVMYQKGGVCYVYLCYGIHYLFNIVTNLEDIPHAILIRGVIPISNFDLIAKRRNLPKLNYNSCIGPGKVSQTHGFRLDYNSVKLNQFIYLEENNRLSKELEIIASPRIGIDYAEEDANLKYRFHLDDPTLESIFNELYENV